MNNLADIGIGRLLERAVRQAKIDSPRAVALLKSLSGRRLAIQINGTPWYPVVESTGETLRLISTTDATVDVPLDATIAGAPLALLTLAGPDPQAVIRRGDVTISGDAEIAQQFRELGMLLWPDFEAGLSQFIGRSGAHVVARAVRSVVAGARQRAWTLTQNATEYMAHERGDLVSRAEAEHFLRGVDEVRERLDRIEARLQQIDQRMPKVRPEP